MIEDSRSAVPVVKLDAEYISMHRPPDDVSSRCDDVTAAAAADTDDSKETAPDAHVIGNYMNIHLTVGAEFGNVGVLFDIYKCRT